MKAKLLEYWDINREEILIAHVLDPRYKLDLISTKTDKKRVVEALEHIYASYELRYSSELNNRIECNSKNCKQLKFKLTFLFLHFYLILNLSFIYVESSY